MHKENEIYEQIDELKMGVDITSISVFVRKINIMVERLQLLNK